MSLLLGQLVYTSFPIVGFRTLASEQVPIEIQQAFVQQVVYQHWNPYNPPALGYRAAYLHQVTPEHNLFGWLYSDGLDDLGRGHVPYFVCYYLAEQLHAVQLENIFTCLHKGPVKRLDRQSPPAAGLEAIVAPDLWSYQSDCKGVAVSADICERSHLVLRQRRLINLFVPVNERELLPKLNGHHRRQQETPQTSPSLVRGVETGLGDIEQYQRRLQLYEQVLVEAVQQRYPLGEGTRTRLKLLQQTSGLKDEDVALIETQIIQRSAADQSTDNGSRAREEQRASAPKAITPVKSLNKATAPAYSESFVLADERPGIRFTFRSPLWGLVIIATLFIVALSISLNRQILTPLLSKEAQTDNQKPSTSSQASKTIPGFPTGTSEQAVVSALGKPTQTSIGYWPNTYTARYDLVPNQVTVAYLFDGETGRVRQTEASFSPSVDAEIIQVTLNGMLEGKVTSEIQQGLQQVRQRQSSQYSFAVGSLRGVIEQKEGRVYVGVWDTDLE